MFTVNRCQKQDIHGHIYINKQVTVTGDLIKIFSSVFFCQHYFDDCGGLDLTLKGGHGCLMSGISGLSFDSLCLSPLLLFSA